MPKVQLDRLISFYTDVLTAEGLPPERGAALAEVQCRIHGFGVKTHSLRPLHHIIHDLSKGVRRGDAPALVKKTGAVEVYDCSDCISVENIRFGVGRGMKLAAESGIGWISLHDTGWIGALGYHLAEAARQGYIALGWVNASVFHGVAPFGGRDARLSTNPMGFSFPTGSDPVVVDFSTSAVSNGKAHSWISRGEVAPEKIFLDSQGKAVEDPSVLEKGGAMMPAGGSNYGYKGTALSLLIEALTAASGAVPVNREKEGGHNAHLLVLAPQEDSDSRFTGMIDELLEWVGSSRPLGAGSGVRIPGMRGWEALKAAEKEGMDISDTYSTNIEKLAEVYGLSRPFEF